MSGSGSGMPSYGAQEDVSCENLVLFVTLSSPIEVAIKDIEKGDILEVVQNNEVVQVLNKNGEPAGSILSGSQAKLLKCIVEGTEYAALVTEKKGAYCRVKIYHI